MYCVQKCVCVQRCVLIKPLHLVSEHRRQETTTTSVQMTTNKNKESSFGLSYPMLTKTNYTVWALKMKVFMQAHDVWEAIEAKDSQTTAAVDDKIDKRALAIIYQGVPYDVLLSLAEKQTSKDAWKAVKTMFQGAD